MIDEKRVIDKIRNANAKRVLIQVPEGLKMSVAGIASMIEKHGIEAIVSVEPCYGACDIRDRDARDLKCDLVLHIGHSDYGVKTSVPVIYEEYRIEFDPVPVLKRDVGSFSGFRTIGLVASIQYLDAIERVREFLESAGKRVLAGKPNIAKHPGQILGCDFSAAKSIEYDVDCFLYIGSGRFHPLGLALCSKKPVFSVCPESDRIVEFSGEKERMEMIRIAQIEKARESEKFGIIVSTKPGQMRIDKAINVKRKLESAGKQVWIFSGDEITPEKLLGIDIEVIVNTACPRIRDDWKLFGKTIINAEDVEKIV